MKYIKSILAVLAVGVFFVLSLKIPVFILNQAEKQTLNHLYVLKRPNDTLKNAEAKHMSTKEKLEFLVNYAGTGTAQIGDSGAYNNTSTSTPEASVKEQELLLSNIREQIKKMVSFGAFPEMDVASITLTEWYKRSYVHFGQERREVVLWQLYVETEAYAIFLTADAETFSIYQYAIEGKRFFSNELYRFCQRENFFEQLANNFSLYLGIRSEEFFQWFHVTVSDNNFKVFLPNL